MSAVHVNYTRDDRVWWQLNPCPTCASDQPMVGQWQEWYGTRWTCLTCGDRWADGERLPRPFMRGWRQANVAAARRALARAAKDGAA